MKQLLLGIACRGCGVLFSCNLHSAGAADQLCFFCWLPTLDDAWADLPGEPETGG